MRTGWEIVCPDGKVRHYPYINFEDAEFDAKTAASGKCQFYPTPGALEVQHGPCPGGPHGLRPTALPTGGDA